MSKEIQSSGAEHASWKAANSAPLKRPERVGGGEIDPSKIKNIGGGIYDATVEMPALSPEQLGLTREQIGLDKSPDSTETVTVPKAEMSGEQIQQLVDDVKVVLQNRREILLGGERVAFNFQRETALGDLEKLLDQPNVFGDPETKAAVQGVAKGLLYGKEGLKGLINEKTLSDFDVELLALLNQIADI
ncbi:MAG: hypothetical protein AAB886_02215 [Patescibacteria group bacterium]